jgi:phosphoenolpyruvate phosphomutase
MGSLAQSFRAHLKADGPVIAIGAYDALSARLAKIHGFDALWASSYCLSAAYGFPDAGLLTITELLTISEILIRSTELPTLVDCDNGFQDLFQLKRAVQVLERAGVAAICIEDAAVPKRSSLYDVPQRRLAPADEFALKIRVAKEAQRSTDFAVIARTEAFVAKRGAAEAAERVARYVEAGADLVLIHSVSDNPGEVFQFLAQARLPVPVALVPTTFWRSSCQELHRSGVKLLIYANQTMRAAVGAIREVLRTLAEAGKVDPTAGNLATVAEINDLVGYRELVSFEKRYALPNGQANHPR